MSANTCSAAPTSTAAAGPVQADSRPCSPKLPLAAKANTDSLCDVLYSSDYSGKMLMKIKNKNKTKKTTNQNKQLGLVFSVFVVVC